MNNKVVISVVSGCMVINDMGGISHNSVCTFFYDDFQILDKG